MRLTACALSVKPDGVPAPPGGAVAQRLRGFKSAEPEKTVKRSSRRTGVNLQFFPVQPTPLGLKGASSPFFVAPARRNRWWFSGSLLPPKENISRQRPPTPAERTLFWFSLPPKRTSTVFRLLPHLYAQKVVFCRISTQSLTKGVIFCILSLSALAQFSCCVSGC